MLSQRSCDDVVDDAIEIWPDAGTGGCSSKDEAMCQGGFGNGIYVGARNGFSKLAKIAVAGIQV